MGRRHRPAGRSVAAHQRRHLRSDHGCRTPDGWRHRPQPHQHPHLLCAGGGHPVLVHNSGGTCPLYRSDTRGPDEIFEPRGGNMDLLEHASGYSRDSGYISTTTSESVAIRRGGNVYEIRGVGGVDVNKEFPGNPYAHEREIAIPGRVDTSCIVACRLRDGTRVPNPKYGGG
ncbi:hypothetical protein [Streptomyces sp. ST2-7A]|uniref:scabin-related ADP-ribosyltransferase n=1 Tax=Streptomyces sp. ST2-7A TaxID=2907214 RepID=UPI0035AC1273